MHSVNALAREFGKCEVSMFWAMRRRSITECPDGFWFRAWAGALPR